MTTWKTRQVPVLARTVSLVPLQRVSDMAPVTCIVLAILLANLPSLFHLVTTNPLVIDANIAYPGHGLLPGLPYIDPNAGYTTQALGHLAVTDWIHGHIPWWNPYEGLGAPLAGEMQSGAFFPPTLLLALDDGIPLLRLLLEVVTGVSTYFLTRSLGCGRAPSAAAGVAFGLCGTYAWFAHAPIRPVAFLPLCLLGVERARASAAGRRPGGWILLAVALCLSVLAGFPETAFLDGIFVFWWSLLRVVGSDPTYRRATLQKLAAGLLVGLGLSAPLLAALAGYLPDAFVGAHSGTFAHVSLLRSGLTQLILPYSLGPIFGFHSGVGGTDILSQLWGNVGGFLSVTLIAGGLVGLVGRGLRPLRLGLGAWVAVCLLRTFGFAPLVNLLALFPGVRLTAFYRYSDPSWELAIVILAALGIDGIARGETPRRLIVAGSAVTGLLAVWAAVAAWPILSNASGSVVDHGQAYLYPLCSLAGACVALVLFAVGGWWAGRPFTPPDSESLRGIEPNDRLRKLGRVVMSGIVAAESMLLFGFTYLSAPPSAPLQTASFQWLQAHLGSYRFVTLGPLQPNYGSYFGIAEANANDLPLPKSWVTFVGTHLDTNAPPGVFSGTARLDPNGPTPAQELSANLANYEAIGVRYVIEPAGGRDLQGNPFPPDHTPPWPAGPRLVHHDVLTEIWELPDAAPPISVYPSSPLSHSSSASRACTVDHLGWNRATVHCPHASVLVRRVQYLPGWSATANGQAVPIRRDRTGPGGLFEVVDVPAGSTTLNFVYRPPWLNLAVGVAVLALAWLIGAIVVPRVRARGRGLDGEGRSELPSRT